MLTPPLFLQALKGLLALGQWLGENGLALCVL